MNRTNLLFQEEMNKRDLQIEEVTKIMLESFFKLIFS